ncbi:unnamed protein product, partial [marine sediment metagenome]
MTMKKTTYAFSVYLLPQDIQIIEKELREEYP